MIIRKIHLLLLFLVFASTGLRAGTPPANAIASAHPLATAAGMEIFAQGGNAFDAAVAVTAALAVVEPYSSGLGGGGFWLIHRASDGFETMIDGRETTPSSGHKDMYLDKNGEVNSDLSMNGPLSAGIPGVPAAMVHLSKKYGKLKLRQTLAPAIKLAKQGFAVDEYYQRLAGFRKDVIKRWPEGEKLFLKNGDVPPVGHLIKQKDLAQTLDFIAKKGNGGFYQGRIAQMLVDGVQKAGGIWTMKDLAAYKVIERDPIRGEYKGHKITTAAPPSSGGIVLVDMLNILSAYDLEKMERVQRTHLIVEAMRRAYRDRSIYLGDPDFVKIPVDTLTSAQYAAGQRSSINPQKATPSNLLTGEPAPAESHHTTHFSIMDKAGNRVAATVTVNYPFGSGFVAKGTGVLLNDEMDDFSAKPGVPNAYGLVGAAANAIAPRKRPLSSMTPSFVESPDSVAVIGTPGGSRIITMVLLGLLDHASGNKPQSWVSLPRFHHQYLPDKIFYEDNAFDEIELDQLQERGHELEQARFRYGNMQAILWDKKDNKVYAASDPRAVGESKVVE
ncbi:MAG: gamma-glutamyltransferase [Gammaproteobacteria bacterium]|nr:gamma-glutamyltransferase [Gammaproteobacteria bacterium]